MNKMKKTTALVGAILRFWFNLKHSSQKSLILLVLVSICCHKIEANIKVNLGKQNHACIFANKKQWSSIAI